MKTLIRMIVACVVSNHVYYWRKLQWNSSLYKLMKMDVQ